MKRLRQILVASAAIAVPLIPLVPGVSEAQEPQTCHVTDFMTVVNKQLSFAERYSVLSQMTEQNFNQARTQFGQNGSFSIAGIDVTNSMNWGQFNEARRRITNYYRFEGDSQAERSYAASYLTAIAAGAYTACLEARERASATLGLAMWIVSGGPSSDRIVARVRFNQGANETVRRRFYAEVSGASLSQTQLQIIERPFTGGNRLFDVTIPRSNVEVPFSLSLGVVPLNEDNTVRADPNEMAQVGVTRRPEIFRLLEEASFQTLTGAAGATSPAREGNARVCGFATSPADPVDSRDWRFSPTGVAEVSASTPSKAGESAECHPSVESLTENQLCARIRVTGHGGRDVSCSVTWTARRVRSMWVPVSRLGPLAEDANLTYSMYLRLGGAAPTPRQ